mgnify:CR=1 FL=1
MRIAVDMDGVCYEWERTARYMLREYRDVVTPESTAWDSIKDDIPREDWKWLWTWGVQQGLFRYGHMVTGARIGLQELVSQGHALAIVSEANLDFLERAVEAG